MATGRGEELVRSGGRSDQKVERVPGTSFIARRLRRHGPDEGDGAARGRGLRDRTPRYKLRVMFLSNNFLGIPETENTLEKSRVVVLPVPYERTVSYGVGTRNGPAAIIEASHYVELYDDELDEEVYRIGIHTLPAWLPDDMEPAACVEGLEGVVAELLDPAALRPDARRRALDRAGSHPRAPRALSGSVDPPLRRARRPARRVRGPEDTRTPARRAGGSSWASRRSTSASGRSRGRRSSSSARTELLIVSNRRCTAVDDWMPEALARLTDEVYVTFDVDFFDGSLVPGTGTPEPGGGTYDQALEILRRVASEKRIVGADVVEHSPLPGNRAPDFMVAKLCYKLLGYSLFPEEGPRAWSSRAGEVRG